MRINTNMAALNAWRSMSSNQTNLQKSLGRLSSGYRINTAADDAAGLAVSEKMRAQIRGINMATRNTQDAVSLMQTAEGGAGKVQDMLQRMRELAVQASSDTLQDTDRAKLQEEFTSLRDEIDRTASSVTFNGRALINGASGDQATIADTAVGITSATATEFDTTMTARTLNVSGVTLATQDEWTSAVADGTSTAGTGVFAAGTTLDATFDDGLDTAAATSSKLIISQGSKAATIDFSAADAASGKANLSLDTGTEFVAYVNAQLTANGIDATASIAGGTIVLEANTAGSAGNLTIVESGFAKSATFGYTGGAHTVTGADATLTLVDNSTGGTVSAATDYSVVGNVLTTKSTSTYKGLSFTLDSTVAEASITGDISISRNGLTFQVGANSGETISATLGNLTATNLKVDNLQIGDKTAATGALSTLDTAISTVSTERAKMGALQNRLDNTISNLQTQGENLTAAESRIRDVDMAQEMANFTKFQVLSQASTAMLAQANQLSQGILSLLR